MNRPDARQLNHNLSYLLKRNLIEMSQPVTAYGFNSQDFAYSLRCQLCRDEALHSLEQHDILRFGIEVK